MGDILSQAEIDAMLSGASATSSAVAAPEVLQPVPQAESIYQTFFSSAKEHKKVGLYDFTRPERISKDQINTLRNLHDGYTRMLSTTLTNILRTFVSISLKSVEQLTYGEVVKSITPPSCIYVFQMEPLESSAIMDVSPSLVFTMLDRLFGGQGRYMQDSSSEENVMTDIEKNVMYKIVERSLADLKVVWESVGIFSPKIENYEINPQFVQIAPPGETVVLVTMDVSTDKGSGFMSLCFPFMLLESIIEKLSGESWISAQKTTTQETRRMVERELSSTNATLRAEIGSTQLSVRDFLQLSVSDVMVLDKLAGSDLVMFIEDRPKFLGKPGVVGRAKSFQITGIIDREVGDED
ncbi:MAG: flagellar motor switch protein FliM [Fibromonadaceae bacterium]|jgi:flagellar motor switch protein FliM|nr:flagellar motor switch protein FliM [Fibromonadaceae bacterium]